MANEFVSFNPYDEQLEALRQRQRMADMLRQQSMEPLESRVAPGGYVVPTSPILGLAKMLQAYGAGRSQRAIDKEMSELRSRAAYDTRQQQAEQTAAMKGIVGRLTGQRDEVGPMEQAVLTGAPMPPKPITVTPQMDRAGQILSGKDEELAEFAPTAQYRYDPEDAQQMAMNLPAFDPSTRGQMLAAALKQTMEKPEAKEATRTTLSRLIAERDALPPNSPLRATYDSAISKETKPSAGVTVNYGTPVAGVDEQGNPVFFQPNREGGTPAIIPGVRPKPEAMGAAESNSATFADRMANAIETLNTLSPVSISQQVTGAIPLVGNTLINATSRQFKQAERDFITAVLRKESGAVIGANEYNEEVKKYIPLAGDDPQTLEMKRKARETALAGMRRAAGPSYKPATISFGASTDANDPLGLRK